MPCTLIGDMEQMTSYVLVLFDYDGCTLITTPRHLTGASSEVPNIASRTTMMYKGKQHVVEILQKSDSFESLDAFEDEWTDSHRSLELTQEKQRRSRRKGNKYGGFLNIWPADPQDTVADSTDVLDIPTSQSKTTNKRLKEKQASQSRITADGTTLPKQTHIEGTNGRKVTVHFEGAEERNPQNVLPLRQPYFTDGLSDDQTDLVDLHVKQHQLNRCITATQTDDVILFDTVEEFERELQRNKQGFSKSVQCQPNEPITLTIGTQTDCMEIQDDQNNIILEKLDRLISLQKRRLGITSSEEDIEVTPQMPALSRPVLRKRLELDHTSSHPSNSTATDVPDSPKNNCTSTMASTSSNSSTPNESLISVYDFAASCSPNSSTSRPVSPILSTSRSATPFPSVSTDDLFTFLESDGTVPCSGQSTLYNFEIRTSDQPQIFNLEEQTPELSVEDLSAETLFNLKDNRTNKLFAWTLTKKLFTPQEFVGRNFYGNRGKEGLSPRRRRAIISAIQRTCGSGELKKAVEGINSGLRKYNQ